MTLELKLALQDVEDAMSSTLVAIRTLLFYPTIPAEMREGLLRAMEKSQRVMLVLRELVIVGEPGKEVGDGE
jgi:hypothetical protein